MCAYCILHTALHPSAHSHTHTHSLWKYWNGWALFDIAHILERSMACGKWIKYTICIGRLKQQWESMGTLVCGKCVGPAFYLSVDEINRNEIFSLNKSILEAFEVAHKMCSILFAIIRNKNNLEWYFQNVKDIKANQFLTCLSFLTK